MNIPLLASLLVLQGTITEKEADMISLYLKGKQIPVEWRMVIAQVESAIGRRIEF